ncbi:nucleoside-diphosphate kinase [Collinsella intestinalis]|uniref:nucleoside-diphosphate kinase n=1 Tax=Collinsella intestinalis TaxID=147207 RepID=UPI001D89A2FA|nr:nucleoside-diphosphate kinase [Collinsella intestinalis]MBM6908802.1 nucleoside-diphosphate kinase [Collinsella intestinalis]HIU05108.1 nucleoside-diphosphate kinase [Candidatus Coprousia avicola]
MADIERTYIMIKPDAVRDRKVGEIITRIERTGLTIERLDMATLDADTVREHYAHLADKPFFADLVAFMTSGPVVKMIVSGLGAIGKMRTIMGATNPLDAAPGTIRGDFAVDVNSNIIHGSDGPDTAAIEIRRFFGEDA